MIRGKEVLPPPSNITRTGQKQPPPPPPPSKLRQAPGQTNKASSPSLNTPPPPLPTRKNSNQPCPTLPPRKVSGSPSIRSSSEFSASTPSVSSNSTGPDRSFPDGAPPPKPPRPAASRMRAPPLGGAVLPPVVPKKKSGILNANVNEIRGRTPQEHDAPSVTSLRSKLVSDDKFPRSLPAGKPWLPHRRDSSPNEVEGQQKKLPERKTVPPVLPRRESNPAESEKQQQQLPECKAVPPALPKRESSPVARRKLPPPPPPRGAAPNTIKSNSFATLNKNVEEPGQTSTASIGSQQPQLETQAQHSKAEIPSPLPPPIPLASRPKLSQIQQASQPHIAPSFTNNINNNSNSTSTTPTTVCLLCRDFSGPDSHAARFPRQSLPSHDLAWLATQLTSPFSSATDKARVIFTWLHHNVAYDVDGFFNKRKQSQAPDHTITTGLAVCAGYANLFEIIATHAGLQAKTISGHGMGYGSKPLQPGSAVPPFKSSHAWNVVRIDNGEWKLIDTCWGAGSVNGPNEPYSKHFKPQFFTMSNARFSLKHFPTDQSEFYLDHNISNPSWEEYMRGAISSRLNISSDPPTIFDGSISNHGLEVSTFQPASKSISAQQNAGKPVHFQFGLICEHWSITNHGGKTAPALFLLRIHGVDAQKGEYVPFNHVRGTNPGGGGDYWYLDINDARTLGCAGQKLIVYEITSFGKRTEVRGMTKREFNEGYKKVGMSFSAVAEWQLV